MGALRECPVAAAPASVAGRSVVGTVERAETVSARLLWAT